MVLRMYLPQPQALNGTWQLPLARLGHLLHQAKINSKEDVKKESTKQDGSVRITKSIAK